MARRANISDVAEKAGVSVSTIDRIMNGRAQVRPATAKKVIEAAEELQFYALPTLKERLNIDRPVIRLGFLLQQGHRTFYKLIAEALHQAAQVSGIAIELVVEHMNDLSPEAVSSNILRIGERVQALAIVSAEHARVSHAIELLASQGIPTYGLISELSAACGVGYIGLDNWKVGRTAAWAISGLCKKPGRVGILVGNHRYRCQELNESGFRSYCREHGTNFTLLEPMQTFEDRSIARDVTEQLMRREPDLVGLYVSGGGMVGVLEALKATGKGNSIVTVGHEITDHTRIGLINNEISLVLAHPIGRLASEAITVMVQGINSKPVLTKRILGFDLFTPENI